MVRLVAVALLVLGVAAPAAGQSAASSANWRLRDTATPTANRELPSINVGAYGQFGLGMFGLKPEVPRSRPVTGGEVSAPKQRRAGIGFSLKF